MQTGKNKFRDLTLDQVTEKQIGSEIRVAGWVENIRNHGGIIFVDLRDMYGTVQIVFRDTKVFTDLNREDCISVFGKIVKRREEDYNEKISTGTIELEVLQIDILGQVQKSLPFEISKSKEVNQEIRLKYRYLDLRNEQVKKNIILRSQIIHFMRAKMTNLGFLEIQTPILCASSPEGARDYIVPSRKFEGKFYALPQAPQQYKQLLMVSGFDKYFQIAPCFRDEDARADRCPGEFYQLDFEMSFATQEDVLKVGEEVLSETFKKFAPKGYQVTDIPFPIISYRESMLRYGSDKPDLRNPLTIIDVTDIFQKCDFKPFHNKTVRAVKVHQNMSKGFHEKLLQFARSIGMDGLGYLQLVENGLFKGPIAKFMPDKFKKELCELASLETNDTIFFIADKEAKAAEYAGKIRTELGEKLDLIEKRAYRFCYINDFPMFEYNETEDAIRFTHNPFSMPQGGLEALNTKHYSEILAQQYDIVCNGVELSSGAVRNHDIKTMLRAFEIAGYDKATLKNKFSALYNAFQFGAPPHAGMAPGIDRILMLLTEEENIREVIAFPMNGNAQDLMCNAPGEVTEQQLKDVHIQIIGQEAEPIRTQESKQKAAVTDEITNEVIDYVSKLSRLELSDQEKKQAKKDMLDMIGYINLLNKLDTDGIEPMSHNFTTCNVFRDDTLNSGNERDNMLKNAPDVKDYMYRVPKTFA